MESLITIILLIAGSALANWLKQKSEKDQTKEWQELEDWVGRNDPPESTRPADPPTWEEAPPPAAPPVFRIPERRQQPAPEPMVWREEARRVEPLDRRAPAAPPVVTWTSAEEAEAPPGTTLAELSKSREAYQRAAELHKSVAARFKQVDERTARRRAIPPIKANEFVKMLRDPRTARQAIVASLILDKPAWRANEPA